MLIIGGIILAIVGGFFMMSIIRAGAEADREEFYSALNAATKAALKDKKS